MTDDHHPRAGHAASPPARVQERVARRFRSLLYAPGDQVDLIDAAIASPADALILDLEDRVPPGRKVAARSIVRSCIADEGRHRLVYVRINPLDSGMSRDDLDAVAIPGLEGVRVPKVESVAEVQAVDALLTEVERAHGLPLGAVQLSLGLESARAVALAFDLCAASPRVSSVAPGLGRGGDLQTDVGYVWTEDGIETLYIRSKVVLDARAAGIPIPLDGGYGTYRGYDPVTEEAAFVHSAETGRRLGYRAKICFHPTQVETINRIFAWADSEPPPRQAAPTRTTSQEG